MKKKTLRAYDVRTTLFVSFKILSHLFFSKDVASIRTTRTAASDPFLQSFRTPDVHAEYESLYGIYAQDAAPDLRTGEKADGRRM
ncbi:hypothetical protein HBI44_060690 [Parastagonospora nodorum]|nr:hypothetical protein HBI44_060690 [Parastagonospora nodorum]